MKKIIVVVATLVLTIGLLSGCGGNKEDSIAIAGSTSVQPLSEALAANYMENNSGVDIQVQGGGSGQAIKSLNEGIAQIGALSRELADEEKGEVATEYVIAKDGVAIVAHSDVGVEDLTLEEIKKIFTGEVTNWKEVGGNDKAIVVVSREEGSGTRGAFVEITGVEEDDTDNTTKDALVQASTGAVMETVSGTPDSIGYVSLEAVNDQVTTVKVNGVSPSKSTVLDGTYVISRPFIYVVGEDVTEQAQSFIDFVMSSEGQALIEENGFIPVK